MESQEEKRNFLKPLLITLLVIVLVGGTGFGVWYWQNGEAQKQKTDSDKQISELQKQINDLKNTQTTQQTKSKEGSTNSKTANILKIPELGIQITLPTTMPDVYYDFKQVNEYPYNYTNFSTRSLLALGSECSAEQGPLGHISLTERAPNSDGESVATGALIKKVGNKNLYYSMPQSICAEKFSENFDRVKQTGFNLPAFKDALQTATEIQ